MFIMEDPEYAEAAERGRRMHARTLLVEYVLEIKNSRELNGVLAEKEKEIKKLIRKNKDQSRRYAFDREILDDYIQAEYRNIEN